MAGVCNMDTILWMLILTITSQIPSHWAYSSDTEDSCSVSLIIPKTSIKSSCSNMDKFDHKMRSVEGQFAVLRRVINEIQAQVINKVSTDSLSQVTSEVKRKLQALEIDIIPSQEARIDDLESEIVPKIHERIQSLEAEINADGDDRYTAYQGRRGHPRMLVPSRRELLRIMKPHIKIEIDKMKDNIKAEILKELSEGPVINHDRSNTGHQRRHIGQSETGESSDLGDAVLESHNQTAGNESASHDDGGSDGGPISEFDKQLKQLTKAFQSDGRKHNKRSNRNKRKGGTFDNEVPENDIGEGNLQSDTQPRVGVHRAFEAFRQEIKLSLRHETERVKSLTNSHASEVEEKLTQILKIIESLKAHYDERLTEIEFHQGVTDTNNKLEKMEENISNLAIKISALKENILTDSKLRRLLHQEQVTTQNEIYAEMAGITDPMKSEIGYLKDQFEVGHKLQGVIETTLQNFKADIRLKLHFVEKNVTGLVKQMDELNNTINVDYDNVDTEKAQEELRTMNAVNFVYDIIDKWPYIDSNFSRMEEIHENDTEKLDINLNTLHTEIQQLKLNQTDLESHLTAVNTNVATINKTVTTLENTRMNAALNNNEWIEYNFKHTFTRSACYGGKQYVKKTRYKVGQYVGVVACSQSKYKIYLSDSLKDTFLDIGDTRQFGEDHCEFVGGRRLHKVNIDKNTHQFTRIPGYKRADWGQQPMKGILNFFSPTPTWYECGVNIPT